MSGRLSPRRDGAAPPAARADAPFWFPDGAPDRGFDRAFWEPPHQARQAGDPEALNLAGLLGVLRRRWLLVLGVGGLLTVLSAALVLHLPPRYAAEAFLMLDTRKTQVVNIEAVMSGLQTDTAVIRSEVDVVRSRMLIGRVIDTLGLVANPRFNRALNRRPGMLDGMADLLARWLPAGWFDALPLAFTHPLSRDRKLTPAQQREQVIEDLLARLVVANDGKSYGIKLRFEWEDPAIATAVVNTLAKLYIADQIETKGTATRLATAWLKARIDELRDGVRKSDEAVQIYRDQHQIFLGKDTTMAVQLLSELNTQLVTAEAERIQKTAALRQLQSGKVDSDTESVALASPLIQQLRTQEAEVLRVAGEMRARYGDQHPALTTVNSELQDLRQKIQVESGKLARGLANDVASARARESALRDAIESAQQSVAAEDRADVRLRELVREAEANQYIYKNFLSRYMETSKQEDLQQPDARIISLAEVPTRASFPNKKLFVAIAAVLSLGFGVVLAFALERFAAGFRSIDQIGRATGCPGLGILPIVRGARRRPARAADEILDNPASPFSESIRGIRQFVHLAQDERPTRTVLITSATPGEGKTTFAVATGRSLARSGRRVLLIDGDLRCSTLSRVLGTRREVDLEGLTAGTVELSAAIEVDTASGMHFIPSARVNVQSGSSVDFIDSDRFRSLLGKLAEQYDMVLIDSPPVSAVSDAIFLARYADAAIFVVRSGRTRRWMVISALEQLRASGVHLAGVVLSQVNLHQHIRYGQRDVAFAYGQHRDYSHPSF